MEQETALQNERGQENLANINNMHVEEESLSQSESASTSLDNGYTSVAPTLSVWPLSVLIFYVVAGGPYGVEESVKAGGNFYALLFYTIMPFVWSMQESLITAELSCAYPDASGGVVWVEEAFGKYAGWLNGSLSWVSGATDNAIYPVLFLDYLASLINLDDLHPGARFLLFSAFAVGMGYMTWRGLEIVGNVSIAIGILAMSPFLFLVIFSCNKLEPSRWLEMPSLTAEEFSNSSDYDLSGGFFPSAAIGGIMVRPFANNLFWNLNSFDSASAFAEEVGPYPEKVIPRALTLAWIMTVTGYLIPLLFAIGASKGLQEDWDDGYLTVIAQQVAGSWLAKWLVFSAGISNLALYQAELSSDVFQLHGMAHKGLLPSFLGVRSRHGTPTNAIILATIIVIIFCTARLDQLVEMLNFNYGVSLVLEYAAFIKLRITKPDVPRPYRIPLGTIGCVILLLPTMFATAFVMAIASYSTMLVGVVSFGVSTAFFMKFQNGMPSGTSARYHPASTSSTGTENEPVDFELKARTSTGIAFPIDDTHHHVI